MRRSRLLRQLAISAVVGAAVGALSLLGNGASTPVAARADCFSRLRLVRHAIAAFEAQHGHLPGSGAERGNPAEELARELTMPRDARGNPDPHGPYPGLLDSVPVNPFTGSRALVVVPDGVDAVAFAAASRAGWAYLSRPGADRRGPLPAGLVLPCGAASRSGPDSVQALAFEVEDFQPWR